MLRVVAVLFFLLTVCVSDVFAKVNSNRAATVGSSADFRVSRSSFFSRVYSSELLSSDSERIVSLLGKPDLKRFDYPAEIWLYRCEKGTLFLFFEQKSHGSLVSYVEARDTDDELVEDTDDFLQRNF